MSDTHAKHREVAVPDGDLLIHAGDIMTGGLDHKELIDFSDWLHNLPHKNKVVIAGNHDILLEKLPEAKEVFCGEGVHYLEHQAVVIEGLKIFGSPWQPEFFNWAFNLPRGPALAWKWKQIPDDTDILVTHSPPYGQHDHVWERGPGGVHKINVGDLDLLGAVARVKPIIHVFGHIHSDVGYTEQDGTLFVNASVVDERYRVKYKPTVVDLRRYPPGSKGYRSVITPESIGVE